MTKDELTMKKKCHAVFDSSDSIRLNVIQLKAVEPDMSSGKYGPKNDILR